MWIKMITNTGQDIYIAFYFKLLEAMFSSVDAHFVNHFNRDKSSSLFTYLDKTAFKT